MQITAFNPLIITQNSEELVKLFEELGFERRHKKEGINDKDITSFDMKHPDGFRVNVTQVEQMPRDMTSIRMNVRDFNEAYELLKSKGFVVVSGLEADKLSFTGFPLTKDPDRNSAFQQLACLMNRMAIEQKRIQAKVVNDDNEKYAFRIWLLRLGMRGDEYKAARKALMENLSGHAAFRTKEEEEKWKARQKEKRDELKVAKAGA